MRTLPPHYGVARAELSRTEPHHSHAHYRSAPTIKSLHTEHYAKKKDTSVLVFFLILYSENENVAARGYTLLKMCREETVDASSTDNPAKGKEHNPSE